MRPIPCKKLYCPETIQINDSPIAYSNEVGAELIRAICSLFPKSCPPTDFYFTPKSHNQIQISYGWSDYHPLRDAGLLTRVRCIEPSGRIFHQTRPVLNHRYAISAARICIDALKALAAIGLEPPAPTYTRR